jgi:hypothetical protein
MRPICSNDLFEHMGLIIALLYLLFKLLTIKQNHGRA